MVPIDGVMRGAGLPVWGGVPEAFLTEHMPRLVRRCGFEPQSLIACLLPYFAGDAPGNISLYARGMDYHTVLGSRLAAAKAGLEAMYPAARFAAGCDSPPVPEVKAAVAAGLGRIGRNGLLLTERYGSYVFLGWLASDIPLPAPVRACPPLCDGCGRCVRACPANALGGEGLNRSLCLSALSQKKGELTPEEAAAIRKNRMVWGCDVCQRVCPVNRRAERTEVPEFSENLVCSLTSAQLTGDEASLREQYAGRAFYWRGPATLLRNALLTESDS